MGEIIASPHSIPSPHPLEDEEIAKTLELVLADISKAENQSFSSDQDFTATMVHIFTLINSIAYYPKDFFVDFEFFQRLEAIIVSESTPQKARITAFRIIGHVTSQSEEIMSLFFTNCDAVGLFLNCFNSDDVDFFKVSCFFFTNCFRFDPSTEILLEKQFLIQFCERYSFYLSCLSETELDHPLNNALETAARLFLAFVSKLPIFTLENGKEIMNNLLMMMYNCPIFYMLAKYTAHIVLVLGNKFGFFEMIHTTIFEQTISMIFDDRCMDAFPYIVAIINNTLHSDKTKQIPFDFFPCKEVVNLILLKVLDDNLLTNMLYSYISFASFGSDAIAFFLDDQIFKALITVIQANSYNIKILGYEVLWSFVHNGSFEQAQAMVENKDCFELLVESINGDDIQVSFKIIDNHVGPFVEALIKSGPYYLRRFTQFVQALKEKSIELLDCEDENLSQIAGKFLELTEPT